MSLPGLVEFSLNCNQLP